MSAPVIEDVTPPQRAPGYELAYVLMDFAKAIESLPEVAMMEMIELFRLYALAEDAEG